MRKISANYIFPVICPPLKNGIISFSDDGRILEVIDTKGKLKEIASLEFYNGIIIPGILFSGNPAIDYKDDNIHILIQNYIKEAKYLNDKLEFQSWLYKLTIEKARKLDIDKIYGSIEPEKNPGLLLLNNFNFQTMNISENTNIKILVPCMI